MKTNIFVVILIIVLLISVQSSATPNSADRKIAKVTPSGVEIVVPEQAIDAAPVIDPDCCQTTRMIVPTTSAIDKLYFESEGCTIQNELNNATALRCPKGVVIENARKDRIFRPHDLEADIQINADVVWDLGYDGSGVLVAILDSGIDDTHIELSDDIVATKNFVNSPGFDKDGHGTHVSGIITANGIYEINGNYATGDAPGTGIIVGKVCGDFGCYESDIMAGIEWAVAQGADIVNLSLGGGNFGGHCDNDPLAASVNWAVSQGLVVVVSAGNEGSGVSSPACASGAIAVGAVDKSDIRPSWSNYGNALDLVAPGVEILSTYSCEAMGDCGYYWYAYMSGTSMSAPIVSGVAALVLEKNPSYTVDEVKEALYKSATDLELFGWDQYTGWGRVDALGAVEYQKACTLDNDCNDNNECTDDTCDNSTGQCVYTTMPDGTLCSLGICCSGNCVAPTCSSDSDCDNNDACTIGSCNSQGTCDAYCSYTDITECIDGDDCCPVGCDSITDRDCTITEACGDKYCAGSALGEDCFSCPSDCIAGSGASCGNGVCEAGDGEDCVSCPDDCNGKQVGKPSGRFCCGDGDGVNPVSCSDSRCTEGGYTCTEDPVSPSCCGDGYCEGIEDSYNCEIDCGSPPNCGDGNCDQGEDQCSCPEDCGNPPSTETNCFDGVDEDCDGYTDCDDADCDPVCTCLPRGSACTVDSECCSNRCHRGACK